MNPLAFLSGIWDFGSKLFQTGYNSYTNQRDFDYQKELQKQIFEREDTAVQRRMEDLKAAGINPNLAAGSSAGAGAVVGRSTTNDIGVGSALDTLMAVKQIKMQNDQAQILKEQRQQAVNDTLLSNINLAMNIGRGLSIKPIINKDGSMTWDSSWNTERRSITEMPYYQLYKNDFEYQFAQKQLLDYNNDYVNKQLQWFTADHIIQALGSVASDVSLFTPKLSKRIK